MDYAVHFIRDPATCGGETVFRGTRVLLRVVLADLADGASIEEILRDFPSLTEEHVRAAIAFAAAAARDDIPIPVRRRTGLPGGISPRHPRAAPV